MIDSEKYKAKINKLIQEKSLCSVMNNTKWKELKKEYQACHFFHHL